MERVLLISAYLREYLQSQWRPATTLFLLNTASRRGVLTRSFPTAYAPVAPPEIHIVNPEEEEEKGELGISGDEGGAVSDDDDEYVHPSK